MASTEADPPPAESPPADLLPAEQPAESQPADPPFVDDDPLPECTECGACCFSQLPCYVEVFGADYERIGDDAEHWVDFDGHKAHLQMRDGHCAALRIGLVASASGVSPAASDLGVAGGTLGHFTCAIYPRRPETCRTLERGSPMCRAERAHKRSRTLVAVSALIRAR